MTRSANNSLGIWVQKQRKLYRDREKGKPSKILTDERVVSTSMWLLFCVSVSVISSPLTLQLKFTLLLGALLMAHLISQGTFE